MISFLSTTVTTVAHSKSKIISFINCLKIVYSNFYFLFHLDAKLLFHFAKT